MKATQNTKLDRQSFDAMVSSRRACSALGISADGYTEMMSTIAEFATVTKEEFKNGNSLLRRRVRIVAAVFARNEREAAEFLMSVVPSCGFASVGELAESLTRPNVDVPVAKINLAVQMLRRGEKVYNIVAATGHSQDIVHAIDSMLGFTEANIDRLRELVCIALDENMSGPQARARFAPLGNWSITTVNKLMREAREARAALAQEVK